MKTASRPARSRRRWLLRLGVFVLVCWGLWKIAEYFIHLDRYRPLVIARAEEAAGLPVSMRELDLELLPYPAVTAEEVVVGREDFKAAADEVILYPRLGPLLRGRIEIDGIKVKRLEVTLPADLDQLQERVAALRAHWAAMPNERRTGRVRIDRILTRKATLRLGESGEIVAKWDGDVRDVLEETVFADVEALVSSWGDSAWIAGSARIRPGDEQESWGVDGVVELSDLELARVIDHPRAPGLKLDLKAEIEQANRDSAVARITGRVKPARSARAGLGREALLAGDLSAKAWWVNGVLTVNDLAWEAAGGRLEGDITRYEDGRIGCEIRNGQLKEEGLQPFLDMLATDRFRLAVRSGGVCEVRDLLIAAGEGKIPQLVSGSGRAAGLGLELADGSKAFEGIAGTVSVNEGVFEVTELGCPGVSLTGLIRPNFETKEVALQFQGEAELSRERLAAFLDAGPLRDVGGKARFDRIETTLKPGGSGAPFIMEGRIEGGRAALELAGFSGDFREVSGKFSLDSEKFEAKAGAISGQLGPIAVEGRYDLASRRWQGTVEADVSALELPMDPESATTRVASELLQEYGPSAFQLTIVVPGPDTPGLSLDLARKGTPRLVARVQFAAQQGQWLPGAVHVEGDVPLRTLSPLAPEGIAFSGNAEAVFDRKVGRDRFALHADLTPCDVGVGPLVRKRPGQPMSVSVEGKVAGAEWTPQIVSVACLGPMVRGEFREGRFWVDNLDLELDPLSGLLPKEATVSGRIIGNLVTSPVGMRLDLRQVALRLSPEASMDSVDGLLVYHDGLWTATNVAIRGANSDCVLEAGWDSAKWQGRLAGNQLDLNAVVLLWESAEPLRNAAQSHQQPAPKQFMQAELAIDLRSVRYRHARLDAVQAQVIRTPDGFDIRNFWARPYTGSIEGAAKVAQRAGGAGQTASLDLRFAGIDARFIDEIAFEKPRELAGSLDGTFRVSFPIQEGVDPLDGASGTIEFRGRDGSFGKLGLVTKLLTILRTTEVIQLRLPRLKDEGLAFDRCEGVVELENGLATVHKFEANNPTLILSAQGIIDFPRDQTDLVVEASVLGTVTGLMETVGLGKAATGVQTLSSITLAVTGPPENPNVRVVKGGAVDRVVDAVKEGEKTVREKVKDAAGGALRSILGR